MSKDRTELVVLIRPSVTVGPEDTYDVRDRNMKPLKIPVSLEDDLSLPEPGPAKKAKSVPEKAFRANPAGVRTADEAASGSPKTPPPAAPESARGAVRETGTEPPKAVAKEAGNAPAKELKKKAEKAEKADSSQPAAAAQ